MESLLFLDLATQTGWASWTPGRAPSYGHHLLPRCVDANNDTDIGRFLESFEEWLSAIMVFHKTTYLAFEAPYVGPKTSQVTARKLLNLSGFTEYLARRHGLKGRYFETNNTKVRKHFFGKGAGPREMMKRLCLEECARRGFRPKNTDQADALAGLDFMVHELSNIIDIKPDWPPRSAGVLFDAKVHHEHR